MGLIETLAEAVHVQWLAHQRSLGRVSRLSPTGEELMVDWDKLSEAAKELDRMTVRAVLDALPDVGATVVFNGSQP